MNLNALEKKLLRAARGRPPSSEVPYRFEKRIMARIDGARPVDAVAFWGRSLWRGALSCVVIAVIAGIWSTWNAPVESPENLAQEFESAFLAAAHPSIEEIW
jgi:hypothetical protein